MSKQQGIRARHSRSCATAGGAKKCNCTPSYEAWVYLAREGKKVRKTFGGPGALAAARTWRADAVSAASRGAMRAPTPQTVVQAWDEWLAGAKAGTILTRGSSRGRRFKPATLRAYERAYRLRVGPRFGHRRLADITRPDVQEWCESLLGDGLSASAVLNTLDPLRAVFRRAVRRDHVTIDPTTGLDLPTPDGRRERIPSSDDVRDLLAALPDDIRAVWATAAYAGLRRGELRALHWADVDVAAREIRVRRGWDDHEGEIDVKSAAGRRTVPIVAALAAELAEHKLRTGRDGDDLVFGRTATVPFEPSSTRRAALKAWGWRYARPEGLVKARADALEPFGLHELRHHFASVAIAAGANAKALQTAMGHSTIQETFDRYGHLMPGGTDELRARLDAFHERESGRPALAVV